MFTSFTDSLATTSRSSNLVMFILFIILPLVSATFFTGDHGGLGGGSTISTLFGRPNAGGQFGSFYQLALSDVRMCWSTTNLLMFDSMCCVSANGQQYELIYTGWDLTQDISEWLWTGAYATGTANTIYASGGTSGTSGRTVPIYRRRRSVITFIASSSWWRCSEGDGFLFDGDDEEISKARVSLCLLYKRWWRMICRPTHHEHPMQILWMSILPRMQLQLIFSAIHLNYDTSSKRSIVHIMLIICCWLIQAMTDDAESSRKSIKQSLKKVMDPLGFIVLCTAQPFSFSASKSIDYCSMSEKDHSCYVFAIWEKRCKPLSYQVCE